MPLDAICLGAVRDELFGQIQKMKIDKVQQPGRDMIILSLRGGGLASCRLLISAGSGEARIHLTEHMFENPAAPPMFCMLLRKHISGAKIIDIVQLPSERVLAIHLESSDAMGVKSKKCLVIELIGSQSNIILCDSESTIIDCLRRVGSGIDEKRAVLPGLIYRNPPHQTGKIDPQDVSETFMRDLLKKTSSESVEKWLLSTFAAFSPLICREIAWRAYGETDIRFNAIEDDGTALCREFFLLMEQAAAGMSEPWIISDKDGAPFDFSFTHIRQYEKAYLESREESFSLMLDGFFTQASKQKRIKQRSLDTLKRVSTARERTLRKLAAQRLELTETSKRDYLRQCGDIITANFHLLKKGAEYLIADDFFFKDAGGVEGDESVGSGKQRKIKLDPLKTPQQNAARYYKSYTKLKNAERLLAEQIQKGESELEYLESVVSQLERMEGEAEFGEIQSELLQTGYIKKQKELRGRGKKQAESSPLRFVSTTGIQILAGRNNLQNDNLTLKAASKSDVWLHTQKIHGAHVIISCAGGVGSAGGVGGAGGAGTFPDEQTLSEAASIAAYYSSARGSSKVPVDYTYVRNVKKPSGGRPGMVIYKEFKTITAKPDKDLVYRLLDKG